LQESKQLTTTAKTKPTSMGTTAIIMQSCIFIFHHNKKHIFNRATANFNKIRAATAFS